jgi:glycosyltransferase involved in cell wall biosynthesis
MKSGTMRLLIAEYNSSTGTETVSLGIIPELTHLVDCVVWALPPHRAEFYKKRIPASDRLIYEELYWPGPSGFLWRAHGVLRRLDLLVPGIRFVSWMRSRLITLWLKKLIRKHRLTHFFTTWIFNVDVPQLPIPIGAMAMDLNWQHFPENFPDVARPVLDRLFEEWTVQAEAIFPISDFTAEEMRHAFPQSTSRLKVVPHGAQVLSSTTSDDSPTLRPGSAPRNYFYYPASAFAHKDHGTAIEAALDLYARGCDFDLVFSGGKTECFLEKTLLSNAWTESIRELLAKNSSLIDGRIKVLGAIDRTEVEKLFQGARAVVLPSRFEGFGLPLLEAIERGVRVICTDIPPFGEQIRRYDYGNYTSVFPVGDTGAIARLMEATLNSPAEDRLLPKQIAARTQRWTWKDAATAYVDALQKTRDHVAP